MKGTILNLNDINYHYNTMAITGRPEEWRDTVAALLGEGKVEYKPKDLFPQYPMITIWSKDKTALDRVLTKAAEAE